MNQFKNYTNVVALLTCVMHPRIMNAFPNTGSPNLPFFFSRIMNAPLVPEGKEKLPGYFNCKNRTAGAQACEWTLSKRTQRETLRFELGTTDVMVLSAAADVSSRTNKANT